MLAQQLHGDGALTSNDVRVIKGVDKGQALRALQLLGVAKGVVVAFAVQYHLAAQPATACTFTCGVVTGITITARQPRRFADSATPWAWLPADAQITPLARWASVRWAILL